ncbi:MAG TPA: CBS domain-containing protein [Chloroflexota bacterium]|nr:CBS domain-containing protein [Chloroflexota bacterium]
MAFSGVLASEVLRCRIGDAHGKQSRLWDLAIDVAAGDYPPVTNILIQSKVKTVRWLGGADVHWDWKQHRAAGPSLDAAPELGGEEIEQLVLLKRDVLDALVLDIENRQATRANDVWLKEVDGRLVVSAADCTAGGLLRRVLHLKVGSDPETRFLDWKRVEFLRGDPLAAARGRDYHRRVDSLPPPEIARLADALPYLHAAELLTLISDPPAADALEVMSPERQLQVFEELEEDQGRRILALMAPDAAADLLGRLKPDRAQHHLETLAPDRSARIVDLLRYPEDSVGGLMTNDVVWAAGSLTVAEARIHLRDRLKEPDFVSYIYIVDDDESQRLRGLVTLRDFVIADDSRRMEDIMNRWMVTLDPLEAGSIAARRLVDTHFAALPVVARDGKLLGAVTIDAAVAQVAPAAWRAQAPHVFS